MNLVDLHTHSTASDGTYTPEQLVNAAGDMGLTALALTDHDTMAGIEEARAAAKGKSLDFVDGVEISSEYQGVEIHVVGLWVYDHRESMEAALDEVRLARLGRNARIIAKLEDMGCRITEQEVKDLAGTTIGRPHIAQALMHKGYVNSIQEAFDRYIGDGGAANVPKKRIACEKSIELIAKCKGISVMAHPGLIKMDWPEKEKLIKTMADNGLTAMEVQYSAHDSGTTDRLRGLCKRFGLLESGGSDFHGDIKPGIKLGYGKGNLRIHRDIYQKLLERRNETYSL